jgi:hypothetical protein
LVIPSSSEPPKDAALSKRQSDSDKAVTFTKKA